MGNGKGLGKAAPLKRMELQGNCACLALFSQVTPYHALTEKHGATAQSPGKDAFPALPSPPSLSICIRDFRAKANFAWPPSQQKRFTHAHRHTDPAAEGCFQKPERPMNSGLPCRTQCPQGIAASAHLRAVPGSPIPLKRFYPSLTFAAIRAAPQP